MPYIKSTPRSNLSETDHHNKLQSLLHLAYASKDINQWKFTIHPKPEWAARSTVHVFEGKCKKSGITQTWLIDEIEEDAAGSFETRHQEIIEHFTEALIYLDTQIQAYKRALQESSLRRMGVALPDVNFAMAARDALHRGDHPNRYKS